MAAVYIQGSGVGVCKRAVFQSALGVATNIATPTSALPRAPRKMRPHFAWEPARCGRCAPCRGGVFRRVAALRVASGRYAGLFAAPTPTLPHGGGGYRRFVLLRFAIWQSSESLPRCGLRPTGEGGFFAVATRGCLLPPPRPSPTGEGVFRRVVLLRFTI